MLAADRLSKSFGEVVAAAEVSFTVSRGEIVGLLGPNGAGKTTVLRMLAGILTPESGTVRVNEVDARTHGLEVKRRIGFLSGDTQLYQRLTPREVLGYFGRLYEIEPKRLARRIDEILSELEMTSFCDRHCSTLSAGQKQRTNIARACLHEPDVLILDEPTATLDVVSGRFVIEAIRRQKAAGKAVLFSTHIMSEAEYLCDRIVLLNLGRVVGEGRLDELLAASRCTNLTDAFLAAIGRLPIAGAA